MKITDYGLWFLHGGIFTKIPKSEGSYIYLNGSPIGYKPSVLSYVTIGTALLNKIGFKIKPDSPGKGDRICWNFPENYTPTDSDFEEIE